MMTPAMMIAQLDARMPKLTGSSSLARPDEDRGRCDRHGHAAGRQQVAVPGGGRGVHPGQAEDERHRRDEPGDPDEDLDDLECRHVPASASSGAGFGATGRFLNIWSIRSVTT